MENKMTIIYSDDERNLTTPEEATQAEIREYDEAGNCVCAVYGRFIDLDYTDIFTLAEDDEECDEEEEYEEDDEEGV